MTQNEYTLKEMLMEVRADLRDLSERHVRIEETLARYSTKRKKTNVRVAKNEE